MKVVGSLRRFFPLKDLLAYVGLARSTYCYRASHPHTDRFADERHLIHLIFDEARGAYGYRRVTLALERGYGVHLDRKTVAGIMHEEGLRAKGRHKRGYSSYRGTVGKIAPNILARDFTAGEPMSKLVSDITQFSIGDVRACLSPLIDLLDGEVVSRRIGRSPNMEFALGMLDDAMARPSGSGAVIHTDQGFQYQNPRWQARLAAVGCTQSMSGRATAWTMPAPRASSEG